MKDEKELKGSKGSTMGKVKKLQKQYNKILVNLFDQFAAESIEEALEKSEGSFGENIESIVQCATECLKTKVMEELGVSGMGGGAGMGMEDGMGIASIKVIGNGPLGHDEESETEEEEEEESEAEQEAEEATGSEEETEEEEPKKESTNKDKRISASRRSDQVSITEAYVSMYSKDKQNA